MDWRCCHGVTLTLTESSRASRKVEPRTQARCGKTNPVRGLLGVRLLTSS